MLSTICSLDHQCRRDSIFRPGSQLGSQQVRFATCR